MHTRVVMLVLSLHTINLVVLTLLCYAKGGVVPVLCKMFILVGIQRSVYKMFRKYIYIFSICFYLQIHFGDGLA